MVGKMSEGNDVSGSDLAEMDEGGDGGGDEGIWHIQKDKRKRKKSRQQTESSVSEAEGETAVMTEFKIVLKSVKEGVSFDKLNPIKLTKEINSLVGKVKYVKVLRDGSLLIICNDVKQKERALNIKKVLGENVKGRMLDNRKYVCGVISGISPDVPVDDIKTNISGGKVVEVKRLKRNKNGERSDSFSVLLKFEEKTLPDKVFVGYMSYDVRPFIPPPLRCFKCQKFGHVAAVCKGKQKCGRCAGDHEYGKCEEGAPLKCCNCGGGHSSGFRGCEASKRAVEVQKIKTTTGTTYAEAAKKVPVQPMMHSNKKMTGVEERRSDSLECSKIKDDTLLMTKEDFVLFMVEVINCTAQTQKKTEKIQIIVKAAQKYLDFKNASWESIKEKLNETQTSQPQSCSGGPSSLC